jgi:hypothetical protein
MLRILDPALELARSGLSDDEALERLMPAVRAEPRGARLAVRWIERSVERVHNRAYRLIKAAMSGEPVEQPTPELVARMDELDRWLLVPIDDAFGRLEEIVPGLVALRREAEQWREANPGASGSDRAMKSLRLSWKVGALLRFPAKDAALVVRCGAARGIVYEYLSIALGDTERGTMSSSYEEIAAEPFRGRLTWSA